MDFRRATRFRTIVVLVVSMLFMQLALAQYVCPLANADDEIPVATQMASGHPCHEADEDSGSAAQPALCHHHCSNAAQSFEPIKLPTLTLPAIVQVLVVPLTIDVPAHRARTFAARGEAQPPPSPIFLSTQRLRV